MKDNEQKIIRGIELSSKYKNNQLDYIEDLEYKTKRFISDSELNNPELIEPPVRQK